MENFIICEVLSIKPSCQTKSKAFKMSKNAPLQKQPPEVFFKKKCS